MFVPDGGTFAHVDFRQFWELWMIGAVVPAVRAFRFARIFSRGR
jgi:hypothetical protein